MKMQPGRARNGLKPIAEFFGWVTNVTLSDSHWNEKSALHAHAARFVFTKLPDTQTMRFGKVQPLQC